MNQTYELASPVDIQYPVVDTADHEHASSHPQKLRSSLGKLACGVAGAALGMGVALNGAQYHTEIADIPTTITTSISADRSIRIGGEVVDPEAPPFDAGGVAYHDVSVLPLSVDVQLRADSDLVGALIEGDLSTYAAAAQHDVPSEVDAATDFFAKRTLVGGLVGASVAETALMASARIARRQRNMTPHEAAGRSARTAGVWLLATALAGGSVAASFDHTRDWSGSYQPYGVSAGILAPGGGLSPDLYAGTALEKSLQEFESAHACGDSEPLPEVPEVSLTITTFNIKRASLQGAEAIAAQLQATDSDIVGLQEVTEPVLAELSKLLEMEPLHGWTLESDELAYGNAILTRLPVVSRHSYSLPSHDVEPRKLLVATVELPDGGRLSVATTHLTNSSFGVHGDAREPIRTEQAEEVVKILNYDYYANNPVILTGDMNATQYSQTHDIYRQEFTDATLGTDAHQVATSPSTGRTFDYIYTKPGQKSDAPQLQPVAAAVGGGQSSDHCSVSTVVTLGSQR